MVFAKRKKNIFKGPMLNVTSSPNGSVNGGEGRSRQGSHSRSASVNRRSVEIIQEDDEDEIEEVDAFSPITGPGEVEETIFPPIPIAAATPEEPPSSND